MGLQKIFVEERKDATQRKDATLEKKNVTPEKKDAAPERKLTRSLVTFFAMAQLGFGFNFGFANVNNGKLKFAIQSMTTIMGCTMILILAMLFMSYGIGQLWMIIYIIQYIPTFFILFSAKYTLCEFLTDLIATNDSASAVVKYDRVGLVAWFFSSSMFVMKISSAIVYCSLTKCIDGLLLTIQIIIHIPMLALDIIPVANLLLFYHVKNRIRDLKTKLERQEINLDSFQTTYKAVADSFEKFRSSHDAIFIWGFITESPKWMVMIWNHLNLIKSSKSWLLYGCSYAWAAHTTVEICVPAVFAEMINVQTDAIKMILHERLLLETDKTKSHQLTRVLRYVKARPLLLKAWRLVPLDLRLPVAMLSMCTTYLIVIIQFTHLFD